VTPKEWVKHPLAKWYVSFNVAPALAAGDQISSVAVTIYDADGKDVSEDMIAGEPTVISPEVFVWIQAGKDKEDYLLQQKITTAMGEVILDTLRIVVRGFVPPT
jgi:hypothetical protein